MTTPKPVNAGSLWNYPLSDIAVGAEEEAAVVQVIRSKWLSMGPKTAEFEDRFKTLVGTKHALAVSNCTTGLHLALSALSLAPGDEVIVPSLSFVATTNAILYTGAMPVFADIESLSRPVIDPAEIRRKITPRTKAILVMHYGGYPCRMDEIQALATQYGLRVIEDAAHAVGSRFESRSCGTIGNIGCFSFFANKNLPAGEGGMVVTDDDSLFQRMKLQRSHGMTTLSWDKFRGHSSSYDVVDIGYNYRMPELTAAVALCQLDKLERHNAARDRVFEAYIRKLGDQKNLLIPFHREMAPGARHLMAVTLDAANRREGVMAHLRERKIQSSIHYPPIHLFSHYQKNIPSAAHTYPITEEFASKVVTLPFHPLLSQEGVEAISDTLIEALG